MASKAPFATEPDTLGAADISDRARIEFALNEVGSYLTRMEPSSTRETIERQLEIIRRKVRSWGAGSPTHEQARGVLEQIAELRSLARSTLPTVRLRRSAVLAQGLGQIQAPARAQQMPMDRQATRREIRGTRRTP
jgi:hypothetical protein